MLRLGNPDGRGVKEVWKSRWEGGGVKMLPSVGEGCGFFRNNPLHPVSVW